MKLSYKILDLTSIDPVHASVVNQAYHLWKKTYEPILKKSNEVLDLDIFWRSKILSVILDQHEVVGFHLYNTYDLNCEGILEHTYIRQIPNSRLKDILNSEVRKLMSCEYLTVNEKYRGRHDGLVLADLIISLSSKVFVNSPWDAVIGISRVDYKVDQKSQSVGGQVITDIQRHAIKCNIILATKEQITPSLDLQVARYTRALWQSKENTSPWIEIETINGQQRKVA